MNLVSFQIVRSLCAVWKRKRRRWRTRRTRRKMTKRWRRLLVGAPAAGLAASTQCESSLVSLTNVRLSIKAGGPPPSYLLYCKIGWPSLHHCNNSSWTWSQCCCTSNIWECQTQNIKFIIITSVQLGTTNTFQHWSENYDIKKLFFGQSRSIIKLSFIEF